ncbi:EAL domain-containing protein [Sulfurimonas sp.]|uniref:sensor domain-containing protein n=1 Tax=Sulfurimonas sp. TaxID=2022749 RepID=UPI002AB10ACC|nr:EAL domain-containing protein [Sulfurimonas sp.]
MLHLDDNNLKLYDVLLKNYQKLDEDKRYYHSAFNLLGDLVWLKDIDGVFLKCNENAARLIGLQISQIIGKTDYDLFEKDRADYFLEIDKKAMYGNNPIVVKEYLSAADGSFQGYFETTKAPMKDEDGNIIGVLGVSKDINEITIKEKELEKLSQYDTLTDLKNRNAMMNELHIILEKKEKSIKHSLLFIDLDKFKEINDSMGHNIGDEILISVSRRLEKIIEKDDILARFGGDEFTIFLQNTQNNSRDIEVAKKIITILRRPFYIKEHEFFITSSVGISVYPNDSSSVEELLKYADSAMYHAKNSGKDNYKFYNENLSKSLMKKVSIINDLRKAIKNKEFVLYYQIQVDAKENKVVGAEALVRWIHPTRGLIYPIEFIHIAESSGQIVDLGKWVIFEAMKDISQWKKNSVKIDKISINLSTRQLSDEHLILILIQALKATGCKAEWVEFEITESYTMNNFESSVLLLNEIVDLGFSLSIDDFGTGYSSLSYIKKLPISKLKIDKLFVDDIEKSDDDKSIVNAFVLISKSLKLDVIAEGIQTQKQQDELLKIGCNLSQGYLYSKPVPKEELLKVLF